MAQGPRPLLPSWESWTEFQLSGYILAQPQPLWASVGGGVNLQMKYLSVSLSLCHLNKMNISNE